MRRASITLRAPTTTKSWSPTCPSRKRSTATRWPTVVRWDQQLGGPSPPVLGGEPRHARRGHVPPIGGRGGVRYYATRGMFLQNMPRHTVAAGAYVDIDMVNAFPCCCWSAGIQCPYLAQIRSRQRTTARALPCTRDIAKKTDLAVMDGGTYTCTNVRTKVVRSLTELNFSTVVDLGDEQLQLPTSSSMGGSLARSPCSCAARNSPFTAPAHLEAASK